MKEMVGGCCVCSDERGWDENPLVYCDGQGCSVAVHQACYGIVTVPSGPWYCRKCESHERSSKGAEVEKIRCELCPCRDGALKRTDSGGWAHVVCALYIPEVRFGNVTTMEPILISLIPPERYHRQCCICDESGSKGSKSSAVGACMQCNKPGCRQYFHVTCAQTLGLLCEEAGNMTDNVKYCGYCQHHYSKLKRSNNVKIIPPFRPLPSSQHHSADSTSSKDHQISPDIDKVTSKKKPSGSSSSSSSKSSNSSHHSSSSAVPRIAPSNLFSSSSFSSSLNKGSSEKGRKGASPDSHSATKEDSFVLKSEDLKGGTTSNGGDPKKFLKTGDVMTVKLSDVLAASLDRPMRDQPTTPRDKPQPPDIKPHVTLTPIPLSSNDKISEKSTVLFGQPTSSISKGSKDAAHLGSGSADIESTMAEISPKFSANESNLTPAKRSRMNMEFESPTSTHDSRPSRRDGDGNRSSSSADKERSSSLTYAAVKQHSQSQSTPTTRANSVDRHSHKSSKSEAPDDLTKEVEDVEVVQSSMPLRRGPGRPVKRRSTPLEMVQSGPSREEERAEEEKRKKNKRGGRRGGNSYNRREDMSEPPVLEDNSAYERKPRKPVNPPKEEVAPTLSQLKAKADAAKLESSSSSTAAALPAHMFGNALNPASSMAQRMVDTLSQEMETMVAAGVVIGEKEEKPTDKLVGIPVPKYASTLVSNGVGGSASTAAPSSSSAPSGGPPQTLEQLLERQWEQGSQFLMEQAQHLDIAQLLSCLNQLKQDNRALEEHVSSLIQRKEQLIAINARLSIPLGTTLGPINPVANPERVHDGPGAPPHRSGSTNPDMANHNHPPPPPPPGPIMNGRPMNYGGLPVPVVTSHTSPHLPGQGPR